MRPRRAVAALGVSRSTAPAATRPLFSEPSLLIIVDWLIVSCRRVRRRSTRQCEAKRGARSGVFEPDASALGDGCHLAESEPKAAATVLSDALALLELHERLEDVGAHLGRDARTAIGHP